MTTTPLYQNTNGMPATITVIGMLLEMALAIFTNLFLAKNGLIIEMETV
jgi:hypothetical protein